MVATDAGSQSDPAKDVTLREAAYAASSLLLTSLAFYNVMLGFDKIGIRRAGLVKFLMPTIKSLYRATPEPPNVSLQSPGR